MRATTFITSQTLFLLVDFLQRFPAQAPIFRIHRIDRFQFARPGPMNQIQVDIVRLQLLQRIRDGFLRAFVTLMTRMQFGGDEDVGSVGRTS